MKLLLDYEVFHWLVAIKALKQSLPHQIRNHGKYELDSQTSAQFQNGRKFLEIAQALSYIADRPLSAPVLKEGNTQTIRLQNWNLISPVYQDLGVPIEKEIKELIVSGDLQIINEFLKDVYAIAFNSLEKLSVSYPNVQ